MNKQTNQWNRTQSPEIDTNKLNNLVDYKGAQPTGKRWVIQRNSCRGNG